MDDLIHYVAIFSVGAIIGANIGILVAALLFSNRYNRINGE